MRNLLLVTSATFALFFSAAAADEAANKAVGFETKPLLKANKTAASEPLKLPDPGKPEITSVIATIQPGGRTALHQHPVITFIYVLDGEFDIHQGDSVLHYKAGDAVIEPIDSLMQNFNPGSGVTRVLVVYVGEEGTPNMIMAK